MRRKYNYNTKKLSITLSYKDICTLIDFFIIGPFNSSFTCEVTEQLDEIIQDMNQNDYDSVKWESEV